MYYKTVEANSCRGVMRRAMHLRCSLWEPHGKRKGYEATLMEVKNYERLIASGLWVRRKELFVGA